MEKSDFSPSYSYLHQVQRIFQRGKIVYGVNCHQLNRQQEHQYSLRLNEQTTYEEFSDSGIIVQLWLQQHGYQAEQRTGVLSLEDQRGQPYKILFS